MDLERRRTLKLLGCGLVGLSAGTATNNALLGYGEFGNGENLLSQDLHAAVVEHLDAAHLPQPVRVTGLRADAFFATLGEVDVDADLVASLRGGNFRAVSSAVVEAFAGAPPTDPEGVVRGLVEGFRTHSHYDVPRYVAGAVQDNVLFGRVDLRKHFRENVSFEALLEDEESRGMFCYELAWRSIEALHAAPAAEQSPPVFAGWVLDTRHKHAYTIIGSAYWDDGELVLPVTFVDYTHTTLYDDLHATAVLGEGLNAYDDRHRATDIWWTL